MSEASNKVMEPDLARFLSQCDARLSTSTTSRCRPEARLGRPDELSINQEKEIAMINAAQCRAARALVDWSIDQLAAASGLSVEQISSFEAKDTLDKVSTAQLARALDDGGVSFVAERRGRGVGVRFKFGRQLVKRIDIWENEGGPTAGDDIL